MKRYFELALSVLILLALTGCGVVESMQETQAQSEAAAVQLEQELGAKPMIGWNVHNNTLASVNVVFESKHVANLTIGQLEPTVRRAVEFGFKRTPQQLLVSVQLSVQ